MPPSISQNQYDIAIIGGGMVGASLACALGNQPLKIAMIEAHAYQQRDTPPSYDDRAIALSYGTSQIFRSLGIWEQLLPKVTPIKHIHVSDRGHWGFTHIDHQQEHVEALGYVITARELGKTLYGQLPSYANVTVISPAQLTDLVSDDEWVQLTVKNSDATTQINCKLIIAADGGNSSVRNILNIDAKHFDYQQTAITANVSTELPHNNVAYERFTAQGPIAILPVSDRHCSLVWTRHTDKVQPLLELTDDAFLQQLQQEFGHRLGRFTQVGKRNNYPLQLIKASSQVQKRIALIGNAAHTIHPIAGQGFNLGIRDVAALAQIIVDEHRAHRDIGLLGCLQVYEQWRQQDQRRIIGFTDNLVKLFSSRFAPLVLARNIGLVTTDVVAPIKHFLAEHTMGIAGKLPRLARGLPL